MTALWLAAFVVTLAGVMLVAVAYRIAYEAMLRLPWMLPA